MSSSTCVCGNVFMEDAAFCRMCGAPRGQLSVAYAAPPIPTTYAAAPMSPAPISMSYASAPTTTSTIGVSYAAAPSPTTARTSTIVAMAPGQVMVQQPKPTVFVRQQPMISHVPNFEPSILALQAQVAELQQALHLESRARQSVEINFISLKSYYSELSVSVTNAVNISVTKSDTKLGLDWLHQYEKDKNQMMGMIEASQRTANNSVLENNQLRVALQSETSARVGFEEKVDYLQNEIDLLKAHISEFDHFSTTQLQRDLHKIESRGNVQVDFNKGEIRLVNPITFVPRTTRDEPTAEFSKPDAAHNICQDLAEVMNLFNCPAEVEGHTKGGESEFWQTLADDRAHVVVEKIIEHGGDGAKMSSVGKPGKRGMNESKTVVRLDLPEEAKVNMQRANLSNVSGIVS